MKEYRKYSDNDEKERENKRGERALREHYNKDNLYDREIYDNFVEAYVEYGTGYGLTAIYLSDSDVEDLKKGKVIAYHDGEYHHYILYKEEEND